MKIEKTILDGVLLITPDVFGDQRGFFLETWNKDRYSKAGFPDVNFVQDNHSRSKKGVLRGLHYQLKKPQGKLVQVYRGSVFDATVDIRKGSPTFGKWFGVELNDKNHLQLWVPPGFAHGFCVLSDEVDFCYKCTEFYDPQDEGGVIWNDNEIGIEWPLKEVTTSEKDKKYALLSQTSIEKLPVFNV